MTIVVLPAVAHVPVVVVVTHHVVVDPVSSHVMTMRVEVRRVTVHIDHPTTDMKRMLRIVLQRVVGVEVQHVVFVGPFPVAGNLDSIESTAIEHAELLHSVLHFVLKLEPDAGVRVYVGAVTAR